VKSFNARVVLSFLAVGLLASAAPAQTASNIFNFDFAANGSQGTIPSANVIQASDGNLYGTTDYGGLFDPAVMNTVGAGVIYRLSPAGLYTELYECPGTGLGCINPTQLIELPDGNLYGASTFGCPKGNGCLFRITLAGVYTDLYDFTNGTDGSHPYGPLMYSSDDMLYGTTAGDYYLNGTITNAADYGTAFGYKVGLTGGTAGFKQTFIFGPAPNPNPTFGYTPWSGGLTEIGGNLYGTTHYGPQVNQTDGYGAVWYLHANGGASITAGAVLHDFTGAAMDGGIPDGGVRYYQPDGNIYGFTSALGGGASGYGTVYKSGLTSGFTTMEAFPTIAHPVATPAFDTAGNLIFAQFRGGINNDGALDILARTGNNATEIFSYTGNGDGSYPGAVPFFDNQGHLWNVSGMGGTSNVNLGSNGTVDEFSLSTETEAPIKLTSSATKGAPGSSTTLTWQVNNAFSDNEQLCFATSTPADAEWSGIQTGTYSAGVLSGSANVTVAGPKANLYTFAITCGGTESALATLLTGTLTTTTLTAAPNPVKPGANVKLTATVKPSGGTGTPTGTVSFLLGTSVLTSVAVPANGVVNFTASTSGIPDGVYGVTAQYNGDDTFTPSNSALVNIVVKTLTTTTLTASPNPIPHGATVTLTATVTPASGTAVGTVTFTTGTTTLATVALSGGKAVLKAATTGYPAGMYPVVATYAGSATDAGSASSPLNVTLQ
jgi:uncharacterized repeat protein (TIGR03803 family)